MKRFLPVLIVLAFLPFASGLVWIQPSRLTPVVTGTEWVTSVTPGTARNDFTGGVGVKFTAGSSFTITALGRYKVSGNSGSHTVTLYDSGGSSLGSVSVSMSGGSAGSFVYGTVSINVTNGADYYLISDETNGGDQWLNEGDTDISVTAQATHLSSAYHDGTLHVTAVAPNAYGPVSFKY